MCVGNVEEIDCDNYYQTLFQKIFNLYKRTNEVIKLNFDDLLLYILLFRLYSYFRTGTQRRKFDTLGKLKLIRVYSAETFILSQTSE